MCLIGLSLFYLLWMNSWRPYPIKSSVETPSGLYTLAPSVRVPRTEAGGVAYQDYVYLAGGLNQWAGSLQSFTRYDTARRRWEKLPDLPQKINHPGVVAIHDKIFVIGGFGPLGIRLRGFMFADWNPLADVYIYDLKTRNWSKGPSLPSPRGAGGVAVGDEAIWYVGGINADKRIDASFFRLDLKTMLWERRAAMPTARDHLRLEFVDQALYAISGREDDLRHNLRVVEKYDLSTDLWSRAAPIPIGRGGFGSAVYSGKIYVFGGEKVWKCLKAVERYDPVNDRWETLDGLPIARHGIVAGVSGDNIHLISGGRHPRVSVSGIHQIFTPREL